MSSTSTKSVKSAKETASSHDADDKQLWDQEVLHQQRAELEQWAKIGTTITQNIFVPDEKHCGVWHESPNKTRYASFGDSGTTASVSCYGDLIQMSQYLDVGQSGVFTIEQEDTPEPYQVAERAKHLDGLARNMGSKFSFLLIIPDDCCPDEDTPPEVSWVNWRWPRYQYNPPDNNDVKCCYQFMVHDGVVLQQFTLENTTGSPIQVGQFEIRSKVLIRDLDFLDEWYSFNDTPEQRKSEWSDRLGPDGYGHVYMHTLPGHGEHCEDGCSDHAVAAICTTFVNGSAFKFNPEDERTSIFLEEAELGGTGSSQNKVGIVLARKMLILPNHPINWRNFIISATAGDINYWLRQEEEALWDERDVVGLTRCLAKLPMTTSKSSATVATRNDGISQGANDEEPASDLSGNDDSHRAGGKMHESCVNFDMPRSTPKSARNWFPDDHLEYFTWRHLEHLLSVCAVPLSKPGLIKPESEKMVEEESRGISPPVALTCGDMSGHRINTSASFFAFQFLVDVARRLRLLEVKTKYIRSLESRIDVVCSGHVEWLQRVRTIQQEVPIDPKKRPPYNDEVLSNEHILQIGCFAANYWVTGKVMDQESKTWQPQNRMTDTAFQILKLAEYHKFTALKSSEKDPQSIARDLMQDIYVPWLIELDRLDIRETFSWPHSSMNGIIKFRLSDHFWIWKALRCLDDAVTKIRLLTNRRSNRRSENAREIPEEHKIWLLKLHPSAHQFPSSESETLEKAIKGFLETVKRLSPGNVQRAALQRFTAENDALKPASRMLAVTRSAMDTRFLFHGRDAVLFSKMGNDFFIPGNPVVQLWNNTIDAQLHHEENVYTDSNNALRYALGIATGVRGYTLNNTSNASDMVKRSLDVLIGASGSDAFFPGYLDEEGIGPAIFEKEVYRDRFYHADFEINYILLSNAAKLADLSSADCEHSSAVETLAGAGDPPSVAVVTIAHRHSKQSKEPTITTEKGANIQVTADKDKTICSFDNRPTVVMKKSLPFTNTIPATDVNYISDEWLYPYPDFLRGRLDVHESQIEKFVTDAERNPESLANLFSKTSDEANLEDDSSEMEVGRRCGRAALHVLDIRKRKRNSSNMQKAEDNPPIRSADSIGDICEILGAPRTAWYAKKRIISLPYTDPVTASACCLFSTDREEHELRRFFRLHTSYTKDVLDEVSLVHNNWQTELHLSFYLLVVNDDPIKSEALLSHGDNVSFSFFDHPHLKLKRASMSFRFDGDFFDRYWTCHFIEHSPKHSSGEWDHSFNAERITLEKQWSQRKVLELEFLHQILKKMTAEASNFQKEIRKMLDIGEGSLAFVSMDAGRLEYLTRKVSMVQLQRFENILDLVEEDLMANLATLQAKWDHRKADRGGEQPRWTRNDEAKYRTAINKLSVDVERTTGKLQAVCDIIRKLKEFLATTRKNKIEARDHEADVRDRVMADIDRESAERDRVRAERDSLRDADIRYLTYVTVIFQPLGFAASFYGMGGPPESTLIVSLVEFSAAAFAVTIVLIWGYRAVASRRDRDSALENRSIEQYVRTRSALNDKRISLQLVIHFFSGVLGKFGRWIFAILRRLVYDVYERPIAVDFSTRDRYVNDKEKFKV